MLACVFALMVCAPVLAQDPAQVDSNLRYTREFAAANHLIAQVALEEQPGKILQFKLDRYPDVIRITTADGTTFAQVKGKSWLKSKDWGKTGTKVKSDKTTELDWMLGIVEAPFAEPAHNDTSQGGSVWKLLEKITRGDVEFFRFERSREFPKPDAKYPIYTFVKYKSAVDGSLLLNHLAANLRTGDLNLPLEIKFDYLVPLPEGAIKVIPAKPKSGNSP